MSRLYGLSGLMSLLGFIGIFTDEKFFLFAFFTVVDFKYFFKKPDEMQIMQMQRSAAIAYYAAIPAFVLSLMIMVVILGYDFTNSFRVSAGILIAVLFFVKSICEIIDNVKEAKGDPRAKN